MNRIHFPIAFALISLALSGCGSFGTRSTEEAFEKSVDDLCPISTDQTSVDANRVIRGRIVLAAIAGYSYRSIDLFSPKGDVDSDVAQSLTHIKSTYKALDVASEQVSHAIFPVYRADYIDELARAAAVGAQPAIRLSKTLVTGTNVDRIRQGGAIFVSLFEDELYRAAYKDACGRFAAANMQNAEKDANDRIALRCNSLRSLFSSKANQTDFPNTFCTTLSK